MPTVTKVEEPGQEIGKAATRGFAGTAAFYLGKLAAYPLALFSTAQKIVLGVSGLVGSGFILSAIGPVYRSIKGVINKIKTRRAAKK